MFPLMLNKNKILTHGLVMPMGTQNSANIVSGNAQGICPWYDFENYRFNSTVTSLKSQ